MSARKRVLKADFAGRFRPRIGWIVDPKTGTQSNQQARFNLGSDRKEAERRYSKIQELYDDNCRVNGSDVWSPLALSYARELEKGKKQISYPPLDDEFRSEEPAIEYAQMIEVDRQRFPSLDIVPSDPLLYADSAKLNDRLITDRLKQLENEMKELGALLGKTAIPDRLILGTLHEALNSYGDYVRETGGRFPNGELKEYPHLRLVRVERFKREHEDKPLHSLNFDACSSMIFYWRNRPVTLRGNKSSGDNSRHHIGELFRIFRWLDRTELFRWIMPRGLESIPRKVAKIEGERKVSAVTKETYTVEELAELNRHATPLERLLLFGGLNFAMGAAELGRLTKDDVALRQEHPYGKRLNFKTTKEDCYVRFFRPKSDVFGEWPVWPEVVPMLEWAMARADRLKVDRIYIYDNGEPIYKEGRNAQQAFANIWKRLVKRTRKSIPEFPYLPYGSLRDTLPDIVRRDHSDELASMCLAHGNPSKADSLLECYANKPWARHHAAVQSLHEHFAPVFAASPADPTKEQKTYLPVATLNRIEALHKDGLSAGRIAKELKVSVMTVYRELKIVAQGRMAEPRNEYSLGDVSLV